MKNKNHYRHHAEEPEAELHSVVDPCLLVPGCVLGQLEDDVVYPTGYMVEIMMRGRETSTGPSRNIFYRIDFFEFICF